MSAERWAGVDVGAAKGFDLAVVDRGGLVGGPERLAGVEAAVRWLRERRPRVVAVDAPRAPAPSGERSRADERALVRAGVCRLRYTPDTASLAGSPRYYAWVRNGFAMYCALAQERPAAGWTVVECFPTATWSRLGGPRGARTRARWSQGVLDALGLAGLPPRLSQDARDAIGAALTARLHHDGETDKFGDIVVPRA